LHGLRALLILGIRYFPHFKNIVLKFSSAITLKLEGKFIPSEVYGGILPL
jgi:hypothetical protein